jgi:starch phosphorylase
MSTKTASIKLPASLEPLRQLAYNLRWGWHPVTRRLFVDLDPDLWEKGGHNPIRLLAELTPEKLASAAADQEFVRAVNEAHSDLRTYLEDPQTPFQKDFRGDGLKVAYISAEFGIVDCLRIFAGGLGVLAGDHLKSASDVGVPLVGIGLFYNDGYFTQHIDTTGRQQESYDVADSAHLPIVEEHGADGAPLRIRIPMAGRQVHARVWRAQVGRIPLYLLDTNVAPNRADERRITDRLYGGDLEHRLKQEIVLGIGGHRALEALGLGDALLHLNEGHAALAAIERAGRILSAAHAASYTERSVAQLPGAAFRAALASAAEGIVFTTHTPVEAGHDYFPADLLERYLGSYLWQTGVPWKDFVGTGRREPANDKEPFCMTVLALRASSRRNAVSRLHGAVTRHMWHTVWPGTAESDIPIGHVTNGVHLGTWVGPVMRDLFARHLGVSWEHETDPFHWRRIADIPAGELWTARSAQRLKLVEHVRARVAGRKGHAGKLSTLLNPDALTIAFARRFATYKRATLLLSDPERLGSLLSGARPVQFLFACKAHPRDEPGKALLRQVYAFAEQPEYRDCFLFLEGYELDLARYLVQGADVWLNVPIRPYEASGTSGMKAAANGSLNLSIPDGWWAEAWSSHNRLSAPIGWCVEPDEGPAELRNRADATRLLDLLEHEVIPAFWERDAQGLPQAWLERVRASLRQLPPFFSTHRMVGDYVVSSYLREASHTTAQRASASGD